MPPETTRRAAPEAPPADDAVARDTEAHDTEAHEPHTEVRRAEPSRSSTPDAEAASRVPLAGAWSVLIVFLVALAGSLTLYRRVWAHPMTMAVGQANGFNDQMQSMWFLKWVPWQLAHFHNPLRSNVIDVPVGINLAWNTATPTLGLLASPLTFTAGTAFAYNVLMTLAPTLTTLTGFLWLRRHVAFWPAAAVGGLVIGFGSFEAGHLRGHLHLAFAAIIPLMLIFFEDLLWRRPRPQWRSGLYLGVATAAQMGVSEELAVIAVVAVVICMIFYLLVDARALARAARDALAPMGVAVATTLVLAAPLLIVQFGSGAALRLNNSLWHAYPDQYLWPSGNQAWLLFLHPHARLGGAEDSAYVGVLMIAVLTIGVLLNLRDRLVICAVLTAAVLTALTFGDKHWHGIPLPWNALRHLPGFEAILPLRFAFAWWIVVAWLVARFLDQLFAAVRTRDRVRRTSAVLALAVIAVGLATWVPKWDVATRLPHVPRYLTSAHRELPRGSLVLLLPGATPRDASGMYVQAEADFRFAMPFGYAYRKGTTTPATLWPPGTALVQLAIQPTRTDPRGLELGRAELARNHYRAIVVIGGHPHTQECVALAQRLLGRGPDITNDDGLVWLL